MSNVISNWMKNVFGGSRQVPAQTPSEASLYTDYWRLDAGLRYLRSIDPDYAEYGYAFDNKQIQLELELIEAGKLKPNGDFNLTRREATGRKRYITYFSGGAGRSWNGEIPEEYKGLPMIEPLVPEPESLNRVHDYLFDVATALSNDTGKEALGRLELIKAHRAPLNLPSDLSPMTMKSPSFMEARLRAQAAVLIMDFFDNVALPGDGSQSAFSRAETYAKRLQNAYRSAGLNGALYWRMLLLLEITEIAKPNWPHGDGLPRFVCGQANCGHVICRQNSERILRSAGGSALLAPMASRDLFAYYLKNEADFVEVLRSAIASRGNPGWVERASRQLLARGKAERAKLTAAQSVLDFYTLHFRYLPYFKAAQLGFEFLAGDPSQKARWSEFQTLRNEAEEFAARALGALSFDFANSVDQLPILRLRGRYADVAGQSRIAANAMLGNWIENETLIPGFWRKFVTGENEGLPSRASAGGSGS